MNSDDDVPSPIDFRVPADAREWERTAMAKRPWRTAIFERFADELAARRIDRVLELGAGPGMLAAHVLARLAGVDYVALDFSPAMHDLARARGVRASFVERDFREPGWCDGLGTFDAVITLQAVHELRHKRRATRMHAEVREHLAPAGVYLVSDHTAPSSALFMTVEEQARALRDAGFAHVVELAAWDAMVLHAAY